MIVMIAIEYVKYFVDRAHRGLRRMVMVQSPLSILEVKIDGVEIKSHEYGGW
jgi:hypothetical protein